jgi:prophage regulatory protein
MNNFIRDKELAQWLAIHRSTPWRWTHSKPTFPKPMKLSAGVTVWKLSEIEDWLKSQKEVSSEIISR